MQPAPLYHIGSAYVQKDYVKELKSINLVVYTYKNAYIANNNTKTLLIKSKVFYRGQGNPLVVYQTYKEEKCKIVVTHS